MTIHRTLQWAPVLVLAVLAAGCGSGDPDVLFEKGMQDCEGGHYRAAARSLEKACRLEPKHAAAQLWCGVAFWKADKPGDALPHFLAAAQLDASNPMPLEYAALILADRGEWLEVAKRLNEAFRRMPDSPRILNDMGVASAMRGNSAASRIQLAQALRMSPRYPPALYNMAVLSRDALHQPEDARHQFTRYLEVAPDGDKAEQARKALETMGLPPSAKPGRASPRSEIRPDTLMKQAQAAISRQDYDEAAVRLQEAAEAAPASPEPLWGLARLYDGKPGQAERAANAYRAFLHAFADDVRAPQARLRINALASRRLDATSPSTPPPEALAGGELVFHKPEVRNRTEALAALARGSQYYQKRDWDRALFDFKRVVELDDSVPEGYFNLGLIYWNRGDFEHARQLFQTALARRPNWPDARCMLARVYFRQQLGIKGVEHLTEILKTAPSYADAYYELGRYYRETPSRRTQVRNWYGHYLQLAPKGAYAPETSAWLAANP